MMSKLGNRYPHYDMPRKMYYYLFFMYQGKPYVWYIPDCYNESQAQKKGREKLSGTEFQVISRPYKDISGSKVASEMKAENLNNTGDLDRSLQRYKHTELKEENSENNVEQV